ncbi:hypothetical protein PR048_007646 [Dryococelus australis]|uniref:Uncharacterized protein n=1 Tax=Dryococelus australis TaxID=614101 RepID=A0ABQ9HVP8_9NEOP|nr:hypothetical protein PR048_007646 [Dryococelus australis]
MPSCGMRSSGFESLICVVILVFAAFASAEDIKQVTRKREEIRIVSTGYGNGNYNKYSGEYEKGEKLQSNNERGTGIYGESSGYGKASDHIRGSGLGGGVSEGSVKELTITKSVEIPFPEPVIFSVERHGPYPAKVPAQVPVDKPYPVQMRNPESAHVEKPVPHSFEKPIPYPIKLQIKVPVSQSYQIPKSATVQLATPYIVPIAQPAVERKVPAYVNSDSVYVLGSGYDGLGGAYSGLGSLSYGGLSDNGGPTNYISTRFFPGGLSTDFNIHSHGEPSILSSTYLSHSRPSGGYVFGNIEGHSSYSNTGLSQGGSSRGYITGSHEEPSTYNNTGTYQDGSSRGNGVLNSHSSIQAPQGGSSESYMSNSYKIHNSYSNAEQAQGVSSVDSVPRNHEILSSYSSSEPSQSISPERYILSGHGLLSSFSSTGPSQGASPNGYISSSHGVISSYSNAQPSQEGSSVSFIPSSNEVLSSYSSSGPAHGRSEGYLDGTHQVANSYGISGPYQGGLYIGYIPSSHGVFNRYSSSEPAQGGLPKGYFSSIRGALSTNSNDRLFKGYSSRVYVLDSHGKHSSSYSSSGFPKEGSAKGYIPSSDVVPSSHISNGPSEVGLSRNYILSDHGVLRGYSSTVPTQGSSSVGYIPSNHAEFLASIGHLAAIRVQRHIKVVHLEATFLVAIAAMSQPVKVLEEIRLRHKIIWTPLKDSETHVFEGKAAMRREAHAKVALSAFELLGLGRARYLQPGGHLKWGKKCGAGERAIVREKDREGTEGKRMLVNCAGRRQDIPETLALFSLPALRSSTNQLPVPTYNSTGTRSMYAKSQLREAIDSKSLDLTTPNKLLRAAARNVADVFAVALKTPPSRCYVCPDRKQRCHKHSREEIKRPVSNLG